MAIIRYLVSDVERSIAFYTRYLEFRLEQKMSSAFAKVLEGRPDALARRAAEFSRSPNARRATTGTSGWNRFVIEVNDLASRVAEMKQEGMRFRNEIVVGPGGKQILLEDPDGNPIELFEAAV